MSIASARAALLAVVAEDREPHHQVVARVAAARWREGVEAVERVDPDVALRMKLRRLFYSLHCLDLGQEVCEESKLGKQLQAAPGMGSGENVGQLIPNALGAYHGDLVGPPFDDRSGGRVDGESELSSEARGAN